jgi:hypothetical protein
MSATLDGGRPAHDGRTGTDKALVVDVQQTNTAARDVRQGVGPVSGGERRLDVGRHAGGTAHCRRASKDDVVRSASHQGRWRRSWARRTVDRHGAAVGAGDRLLE